MSIEIRNLTKRFGNVTALEDVDLTVETGSIHAIVGENGAGKTTTLRAVSGVVKPTWLFTTTWMVPPVR